MAVCLTLSGYAKGCDATGYGSIKKVVLFEKAGLVFSGLTITQGEVTSGLTLATGYSGYTYDTLKDNSDFSSPHVGDGVTSQIHYEPQINLVFARYTKAIKNEVQELRKADLCAIIQDANDVYWLFGAERGLNVIAGPGAVSGKKLEDPHGMTITLKGIEPNDAYTVTYANLGAQLKALFV